MYIYMRVFFLNFTATMQGTCKEDDVIMNP